LCSLIGLEALATDAKYSNNSNRILNRSELHTLLQACLQKKKASEWVALFTEHHVPAGCVASMDQVMANPTAKEMIREENIEGVATKRLTSIAFTLHP
jgi:crotonobetainyl-CoA:carnitine CoA-transferase CaiB-like acyl-CoA transferase